MKYYIHANNDKGFKEVTEGEFFAISGDETTSIYASKVYRGALTINEVPENLQEAVQVVVDAKIALYGEYQNQEVSATELKTMIEGVI